MKEFIQEIPNNFYHVYLNTYEGTSFNNEDIIGERFTLVLLLGNSGSLTLNNKTVCYITPSLFCLNEVDHLILPEANGTIVKAVFFTPSVVNSQLDFNMVRNIPDGSSANIYLDRDMMKSFIIRKAGYLGQYNLGPISEKKLLGIFYQVQRILESGSSTWPCKSRSYFFEMLLYIDNLFETDAYSDEVMLDEKEEEMNAIILYLHQNYEDKITIQDITERFHISKTTLANMFRSKMDETFLTYLNKLRISIASTMLRDTLLPITDIMLRVGFSDSAHFLRTFKKLSGMTPSAYREKYCWM